MYAYICLYLYRHIYMPIYIGVYIGLYIQVFICRHIYRHIQIYIYTYIQAYILAPRSEAPGSAGVLEGQDSKTLQNGNGYSRLAKCVRNTKLYITCTNINTLRTGLLNCLNARFRGLTFRHLASCIQGQAFRYSPENAFYIFNQQIYFII